MKNFKAVVPLRLGVTNKQTIAINGPHNTHLRFRYTCDENRKQFAIIVAFAIYVPHWNVRYTQFCKLLLYKQQGFKKLQIKQSEGFKI